MLWGLSNSRHPVRCTRHVNEKEKRDRHLRDKAVCSHRPKEEPDVNVNG